MGKIKKLLCEINKHLEAAAIAEMRVDIARETLLNGGSEKGRWRVSKNSGADSKVTFDEMPLMTDDRAYSNS
ncbi:hypothetical protein [Candidatus Magnetominusculus dajiuhuensis]|uniref:hypothetical protein n=1 Tax=Candidatus Magnetominusculus dajiuhuensis TaxID=3137712 RepID=UPI001A0A339B|nr:hypothetical protein [Nitrospirota bacterium]